MRATVYSQTNMVLFAVADIVKLLKTGCSCLISRDEECVLQQASKLPKLKRHAKIGLLILSNAL